MKRQETIETNESYDHGTKGEDEMTEEQFLEGVKRSSKQAYLAAVKIRDAFMEEPRVAVFFDGNASIYRFSLRSGGTNLTLFHIDRIGGLNIWILKKNRRRQDPKTEEFLKDYGEKIRRLFHLSGDRTELIRPVDEVDEDEFIEIVTEIVDRITGASARSFVEKESVDSGYIDLSYSNDNSGYMPKQEDYENTRRRLLREGKTKISPDDMLDAMRQDIEVSGVVLAADWQSVTKENIMAWSSKG